MDKEKLRQIKEDIEDLLNDDSTKNGAKKEVNAHDLQALSFVLHEMYQDFLDFWQDDILPLLNRLEGDSSSNINEKDDLGPETFVWFKTPKDSGWFPGIVGHFGGNELGIWDITGTFWPLDYAEDIQKLQDAKRLQVKNAELRQVLGEAVSQIEYLHEKFQETGSGNQVLTRARSALEK